MLRPKVTKAIIPVAGLGTRFLPATIAQPKEMLPIVDTPVIQYIVEEAAASGIKEIIFITSQTKRAIEDHFDPNFTLEYALAQKKKKAELAMIKKISGMAKFVYVRQREQRGDGHAILCAADLIGDEPVAILFGDDIVDANRPVLRQLIEVYERYGDPVVALQHVPSQQLHRYGVVDAVNVSERTYEIKRFVEKPKPGKAPSNLAVIGKYIITPALVQQLKRTKPDTFGEIRLAGAIKDYVAAGQPAYGYEFEGTRYDCGDKLGFLQATVAFALKRPELREEFGKFLKKMV